jgi:hypothetical protein
VTPRELVVTVPAARDMRRRERLLRRIRGNAFAAGAGDALLSWLEGLAAGGAQLGTAVGDDPSVRSFGYLKQATIIARFEPARLIVLRVYFTGQDWSRR